MNLELSTLTDQLIILFTLVLIGFIATKLHLLSERTSRVLSDLVVNVTNPCAVLASVLSGARILTNAQVLMLGGTAVGMYLVLMLLAQPLPYLLRANPQQRGVLRFMTVFPNMSFLGFPVITALFGKESVFLASIFVLVQQFFCYSYGTGQLGGDSRLTWRILLRPMILASLLACALYALRVEAPSLVQRTLNTLGGVTSPAAMLSIGCSLAGLPLKKVFSQWRSYAFCPVRLILSPLLIWALCFWWMPNERMLQVTVTLAATPAAASTVLLCTKYGGDEEIATGGVFISTLLCLITIPLILLLLF